MIELMPRKDKSMPSLLRTLKNTKLRASQRFSNISNKEVRRVGQNYL